MRKLRILNITYYLGISVLLIANLKNYDNHSRILWIVIPIVLFLAIHPFIRKGILLKEDIKPKAKENSIVYEKLIILQNEQCKKEKAIKSKEKELDDKIIKFKKEKYLFEKAIKEVEKELVKISNEMSGVAYERFVGFCLMIRGWKIIKYTKSSHDFGADIIAKTPKGDKICVQCKRYKEPVGISAVQQVYASEKYYKCRMGAVVTNTRFTGPARILADKTGVMLFDNFPSNERYFL